MIAPHAIVDGWCYNMNCPSKKLASVLFVHLGRFMDDYGKVVNELNPHSSSSSSSSS